MLRFLAVRVVTYSAMISLMFLNTVIRNPVPSTKTRLLPVSPSCFDQSLTLALPRTLSPLVLVFVVTIFPLMLARSGPHMSRALAMSFTSMGQLGIIFALTMPLKSCLLQPHGASRVLGSDYLLLGVSFIVLSHRLNECVRSVV